MRGGLPAIGKKQGQSNLPLGGGDLLTSSSKQRNRLSEGTTAKIETSLFLVFFIPKKKEIPFPPLGRVSWRTKERECRGQGAVKKEARKSSLIYPLNERRTHLPTKLKRSKDEIFQLGRGRGKRGKHE